MYFAVPDKCVCTAGHLYTPHNLIIKNLKGAGGQGGSAPLVNVTSKTSSRFRKVVLNFDYLDVFTFP